MANKISELNPAAALTGTEPVWIEQGGLPLRTTVQTIANLAGGDVTKVGTPVDNQIGVWTGDGTIEGDANFTWDGTRLLLPSGGNDDTPTISFGDGDSGFWESVDDDIRVSISTVSRWTFASSTFGSLTTGGARLWRAAATAIQPGFYFLGDSNTGLGANAVDQLSAIAGGVEMLRLVETGVSTTDQVIIAPAGVIGSATTPGLAFGDGDTGFYEAADDSLNVSVGGTARWNFGATEFRAPVTGPTLRGVAPSATTVTVAPNRNDGDSGLGANAADQLSLIAGGFEMIRLTETTTNSITVNANTDFTDKEVSQMVIKDYGVAKPTELTVSANAVTVTYSEGPAFELDLEAATGTVAVTISGGSPSTTLGEIVIKVKQDSTADRVLTWAGGTFVWTGGSIIDPKTGSDAITIYYLQTFDGGSTWYITGSEYG